MRIEINPKSLQNLEQICEMLYKLHPSVLNSVIDMERIIGEILGVNNSNNMSLKKRELYLNNVDTIIELKEELKEEQELKEELKEEQELKEEDTTEDYSFKKMVNLLHGDGDYAEDIFVFNKLLKYLQLDTYEYIPIKIFVEVEDPVIGRKVRELVRALEKTNSPEQFYLNKREIDEYAYFAEGYGLTMNEDQKKERDKLFENNNPEELKKLLIKEKLYYY